MNLKTIEYEDVKQLLLINPYLTVGEFAKMIKERNDEKNKRLIHRRWVKVEPNSVFGVGA